MPGQNRPIQNGPSRPQVNESVAIQSKPVQDQVHQQSAQSSAIRSPPIQQIPQQAFNRTAVRSPPGQNQNSILSKSNANSGIGAQKSANHVEPSTAAAIPGQMTGKCAYLETTNGDHTRFEVVVGYNKTLIEIFKSMKSKRYEPETKRWNFATREYDELMLQVKVRMGNTIKLEPLERHPSAAAGKSIQAKFTLCSRNRFDVQVDFKPELKAIFDTIHSRKYDSNTKKYSFDLRDYDELLKKIAEKFTHGEVSIVALPKVRIN